MKFAIRPIDGSAWDQVRAIYLEGIATGLATFETEAPSWEVWDSSHLPQCRLGGWAGEKLLGWAALSPVSRRRVYAGVAEFSIYVAAASRGRGVGRALLRALVDESERMGFWTLQGATFAKNSASLQLQATCGFRVVGRRERIGRLNGEWHDTVLTERRSERVGI